MPFSSLESCLVGQKKKICFDFVVVFCSLAPLWWTIFSLYNSFPHTLHTYNSLCYPTTPSQLLPHISFWMVVNCTINAILIDFKFLNTSICIYLYLLPCVIYLYKANIPHSVTIYLFILYHQQKENELDMIPLPSM